MWFKSPSENYLPWWPWSTTRKLTLQTEINCFNYLLSQWVNPAYRKSIPGWQWWMATLTSRELPDLFNRVEQDWDFWWIFFFYLSCWDMLSPSKLSAQFRGRPVETSTHHCVQHPPSFLPLHPLSALKFYIRGQWAPCSCYLAYVNFSRIYGNIVHKSV